MLTVEEIQQIANTTADEVLERINLLNEDIDLRDLFIGSFMGEGAIPMKGRENYKAPCHGCRIDPDKPFEAGNAMLSTKDSIGVLSEQEAREWCSELIEDKDGRCKRAWGIHEAAKKCRQESQGDSTKYFSCFIPYFSKGIK